MEVGGSQVGGGGGSEISTDTSKTSSRQRASRKRSASEGGGGGVSGRSDNRSSSAAAAATAANTTANANGSATATDHDTTSIITYQVLDFQPASYLMMPPNMPVVHSNTGSGVPPTNNGVAAAAAAAAAAGSYGYRGNNTSLRNGNGGNNSNASNGTGNGNGHGVSQPSVNTTANTNTPTTNKLYGLDIPPVPPRNCCAACHGTRNQELRDDTVLLCDGEDCGLEFHLQCCIPQVSEIPAEEWYCFDCSPTGSTEVLQQYLESNDATKADFATWHDYRESLWEIDFQEEAGAVPSPTAPDATSTSVTPSSSSSVIVPRRPKSELDRAYQSHELALHPERKGDGGRLSGNSKKSRAAHRSSGSPGSAHNRMAHPSVVSVPECLRQAVSSSSANVTLKDMDTTGEQHRHPGHFLGRPVRIYNPAGNTYHTGRIVDWRDTSSWPVTETAEAAAAETNHKAKATAKAKSKSPSISVPKMKEYLVRFTAGMDERKTSYQHWIVLEEHALAVGTSLIWGSFELAVVPAILWLRTARELVPVQHLLEESLGQILYEDSHLSLAGTSTTSPSSSSAQANQQQSLSSATKEAIILQWKRHTGVAMARSYGAEQYQLLNLESESVDFFNADAQRIYGSAQEMQVLMALVFAEWHEQEAVRTWHSMVLGNPVGNKVLTSHDEYALGRLAPVRQSILPHTRHHNDHAHATAAPTPHAAPCALVPVGLDRFKIAQILERQGVTVTKDMAAALSANIAAVDVAKYNREARSWMNSSNSAGNNSGGGGGGGSARDVDNRKAASIPTA